MIRSRAPYRPILAAALVAAAIAVPAPLHAADGQLDPTFGSGGRAVAGSSSSLHGGEVAAGPDGRFAVVGAAWREAGDPEDDYDFAVARFKAGGASSVLLERDFNLGPEGHRKDEALSAAHLPDGRLLVCGTASDESGDRIAMLRFTAGATSLTLDAAFGNAGETDLAGGPQPTDRTIDGCRMTRMRDGRILVPFHNGSRGGILRLLPDGEPDPSFGPGHDGYSAPAPHTRTDAILISRALELLDGRLLGVGYRMSEAGDIDLSVVRYLASGELDTAMGSVVPGRQLFDTGNHEVGLDAVRQPEGGIVVATLDFGTDQSWLVRLTPDGHALDPSFGAGGWFAVDLVPHVAGDALQAIAVQADGRLVVAGDTFSTNDVAVMRVLANGSGVDTSFGTAGRTIVSYDPNRPTLDGDRTGSLAMQGADILVAGTTLTGSLRAFAVARLTGTALLRDGFESGTTWAWSAP